MASRARVVMVAMLLVLLTIIPAVELACDGNGDGDDPRHVHANPALASTHDLLPWVALIVPGPDFEPSERLSTVGRPLFVPPRR